MGYRCLRFCVLFFNILFFVSITYKNMHFYRIYMEREFVIVIVLSERNSELIDWLWLKWLTLDTPSCSQNIKVFMQRHFISVFKMASRRSCETMKYLFCRTSLARLICKISSFVSYTNIVHRVFEKAQFILGQLRKGIFEI